MIVRWASSLRRAVQFLTILPVGRLSEPLPGDLARSMAWFPLVGAAVGGGAGLLGRLVGGGGLVSSITALAAATLLTGALHLDGFVDTIDGLAGGRDREARLAIMRDSRVGAVGVVAVWFLLSLKAAFLSLLSGVPFIASLAVAAGLGRWAQACSAYLLPYARPEGGTGKAFVDGLSPSALAVATGCSSVILFLAVWAGGLSVRACLAATACVAGGVLLTGAYFRRSLGGVTGDTLGGVSEVSEMLCLAVLAGCL